MSGRAITPGGNDNDSRHRDILGGPGDANPWRLGGVSLDEVCAMRSGRMCHGSARSSARIRPLLLFGQVEACHAVVRLATPRTSVTGSRGRIGGSHRTVSAGGRGRNGSGGPFARLFGKEGVQSGRIRVGAKLGAKVGIAH